jgi:ribosomal protein S6
MDKVQQRLYELTYVLPGSMTDSEIAQVRSEIQNLLKKFKATVVKEEDWGRKQLAYKITHQGQKQNDGVYTHIVLEVASTQAPLLEREVYLSAKIMRHLMLVTDGQDTPEQKQAE